MMMMSVVHPYTSANVLTGLPKEMVWNNSSWQRCDNDTNFNPMAKIGKRVYLPKMEAQMLMASFYTHPTCEVSLDCTLKQPLRYIL